MTPNSEYVIQWIVIDFNKKNTCRYFLQPFFFALLNEKKKKYKKVKKIYL